MAIQAAAGGCFNSTFTSDGTKQSLANSIETALNSAGWTTVSGHNTTNLLMQTAQTPYPLQMNFRFKAQTNCVVISLESTDGTTIVGGNSTTAGIPLLPSNGEVWRVIANKYQFCIMVDGSPTVARRFALGCVPYVPSFITSVTNAGYLIGNAESDASTTARVSPRSVLGMAQNNCPNFQIAWNSSIWDNANNLQNATNVSQGPAFCEVPQTAGPEGGATINTFYVGPLHWPNGDLITADTWIGSALSFASGESFKRFQLWDSIIVLGSFTASGTPTTTTINSRTCQNITHSNVGTAMGGSSASFCGSVFLFTQ